MNVDDIPVVNLTPYMCRTIFSWLSVKANEVNIDTADIHVLHTIEAYLPEDYAGRIQQLKDKYNAT